MLLDSSERDLHVLRDDRQGGLFNPMVTSNSNHAEKSGDANGMSPVPAPAEPAARRRWPRFGVRALLVATLLACFAFAWLAYLSRSGRLQREAAGRLQREAASAYQIESFLMADSVLLCLLEEGVLTALTIENQSICWKTNLFPKPVEKGRQDALGLSVKPVVESGNVVVAAEAGDVLCLNLKDGREKWTHSRAEPHVMVGGTAADRIRVCAAMENTATKAVRSGWSQAGVTENHLKGG